MAGSSKVVRLVARPLGEPKLSDFAVTEERILEPGPGQVLVRNDWISVDPYMRGRMNDAKSYVPPFKLGECMDGGAVGTVVASDSDIPIGTVVVHHLGWREHATLDARRVRAVDTSSASASECAWADLDEAAALQHTQCLVDGAGGDVIADPEVRLCADALAGAEALAFYIALECVCHPFSPGQPNLLAAAKGPALLRCPTCHST